MIDVNMVVGLPMAAALGFAYGMGPCLISCAPFLGPVFLASDGGIRQSWKIILPLSLGRLTAYISFGGVVGGFGHYVKGVAMSTDINLVIGASVLLMGLALLLRKPETHCSNAVSVESAATEKPIQIVRSHKVRTLLPGGLFLMGIGMALSPCAPLGIVLFSAAMAGHVLDGMLLGLCFGLGAIVIPALFYGIGIAYLGTRLREQLNTWRPAIERLSAVLLVVVGISNLARW